MSAEARLRILFAIAGVTAGGALFAAHVGQPQDYHRFADARGLLGLPNAADTLSNLAFVIAGVLGLGSNRAETTAYRAFFAAVALTGVGSAYYHLAPDDGRLVWDRLPMTLSFASLLAATIGERVDADAGRRLLAPLLALGVASVAYWRASALAGSENLAPYLAFQFGTMALLIAIAILFPSPARGGSTLLWVIAAYGAAKLFEVCDREIYQLGYGLSGHTLKHLAAAGGVLLLGCPLRARKGGLPGCK